MSTAIKPAENETAPVNNDKPLPNSRRIYIDGKQPGVRVPFREISQNQRATSTTRWKRIRRCAFTTRAGPGAIRLPIAMCAKVCHRCVAIGFSRAETSKNMKAVSCNRSTMAT